MLLFIRNYYIHSFFFKKLILPTLLLILILNSNQTDIEKSFLCGFDLIPHTPKELDEANIIPETPNFQKSFINTEDKYKDLVIYIDTINFEKEIEQYNLQKYRELFLDGITKSVKALQTLLKVLPLDRNFQFTDENITNTGINFWNKTMFGTEAKNKNITFKTLGIDLLIFIKFFNST